MGGDKIKDQRVFHYADYRSFWKVEDRIDGLKLTTPKYMKDFYEITSEEEFEDLKKCLLEELQEEKNND